MKPKAYLNSIGVQTGGRGRMPAAHVALIKEAVAKGIVIEGYPAPTTVTASDGTTTTSEVKRAAPETGIIDVGPPLRDESALIAKCQGKTIGMRDVCASCGCSYTYCPCKTPTKWVDSDTVDTVTFFPRPANSPRPNRWW